MKTRKVAIIGLGHVGAHVAYTLCNQGTVDELVLIDKDEKKLASEVQDLRDCIAYMPYPVKISAGDFPDLKDCDVAVNAIGKVALLETLDRLTELNFTIPGVKSYIDKINDSGFNGIFINITNPCDLVTYTFAKGLKLPKGHIFGTGTGLDTSRLISALAIQTGIAHNSINGYMMGEHGAKQFTPWSAVTFNGMPLDTWEKKDDRFKFDRDAFTKAAIGGGWVTFSGKKCTEYGIAATAARMVEAVLRDEKVILPASIGLEGQWGESDLFVGVPCLIGKDGVEEIVEIPLTEEELAKFHECCDGVRKNMEYLKDL
ncbi:MAG: L-lactate dehydrogenase [Clostridia bacterium]|nr:L-lactate dehydrogenase [Clostridia bacterium]